MYAAGVVFLPRQQLTRWPAVVRETHGEVDHARPGSGRSRVWGYGLWEYYRGGFFSRPDMPEGAFSLSYENGLRAILVDVPNQQENRRYFGFPQDVPHYLRDAWATCSPPTEEEQPNAEKFIADRNMPGERFRGGLPPSGRR